MNLQGQHAKVKVRKFTNFEPLYLGDAKSESNATKWVVLVKKGITILQSGLFKKKKTKSFTKNNFDQL